MKNTAIFIVLILSCQILQAQNIRCQDTIVGREPTYFYQFWFDSADIYTPKPSCHKVIQLTDRLTEIAKYNYTDSALKVVGVAAFCNSHYPSDAPWEPQCADTSYDNWYEHLILYKATDTGLVNLASGSYNIRDSFRWMKVFSHTSMSSWEVRALLVPMFEVYFDEPVTVTDSFYVAATNYHGVVDSLTMTYPGPRANYAFYSPWGIPSSCYPQRFMARGGWSNYEWEYSYDSYVWFIFPIIDTVQPVPEVCEPPVGLNVQRQDSTGLSLAWEPGDNNRSWVVAYGLANDDPESYIRLATTSPGHTLRYLTPGTEYAARVRAVCFDDNTYSDWSDTIRFTREGDVSITPADKPDKGLRLYPNPAHNEVTLHSDILLRQVAVFDTKGHKVLEQKAQGYKATLDVRSLPKGSYVVRATTTQDIRTSKLTIE